MHGGATVPNGGQTWLTGEFRGRPNLGFKAPDLRWSIRDFSPEEDIRRADEGWVLVRLRGALNEAYGARLERVVLYGSRARGEPQDESDYDVAVFLRDMPDHWQQMDRLADIGTQIFYEEGRVIHAIAYVAGADRERTPVDDQIRADGIDL